MATLMTPLRSHITPASAPSTSGSAACTVRFALDPSGSVLPEICHDRNATTSAVIAMPDQSANLRPSLVVSSMIPQPTTTAPATIAPTFDGIGTDAPDDCSAAVNRALPAWPDKMPQNTIAIRPATM